MTVSSNNAAVKACDKTHKNILASTLAIDRMTRGEYIAPKLSFLSKVKIFLGRG